MQHPEHSEHASHLSYPLQPTVNATKLQKTVSFESGGTMAQNHKHSG